MSNLPSVSTIICTFNHETTIQASINSALAQDYMPGVPKEIVVVDGCSTDRTAEIVLDSYPKTVKLIRRAVDDRSAAPMRNVGLRHSTGEYLAYLDGDDTWLPNKLSIQVGLMQWAATQGYVETVGVCITNGLKFYEQDASAEFRALRMGEDDFYIGTSKQVIPGLKQANCLGQPSQMLIPRDVFDKIGEWNGPRINGVGSCEDHDLLIRIAKAGYSVMLVGKALVKIGIARTTHYGDDAVSRQAFWKPYTKMLQEEYFPENG